MKTARRFALVFASALSASTVSAGPQWCSGQVSNLFVNSDGVVVIYSSWRKNYDYICSLAEGSAGPSGKACLVWTAMLKNAVHNHTNVALYYAYENAPECSAEMPAGNAFVPTALIQID
jgi:hypothetical protein